MPALAVPIILCGKVPEVAKTVIEKLAPEYDVIHFITNVAAAQSELPQLLRGDAVKPSSGLGSNAKNASIALSGKHPVPAAVLVSPGFTESEFDEMRGVEAAGSVPWLRPSTGFTGSAGTPVAETVVERIKTALAKHELVPGKESAPRDTVWEY